METPLNINKVETKLYGELRGKIERDGKTFYPFILTTNEVDRDEEIVETRGLITDYFLQNPVLLYKHDRWAFPVGSWTNVKLINENGVDKYYGEAWFDEADELSRTARQKVESGSLAMASIGFIRHASQTVPAPIEYIQKFNKPSDTQVTKITTAEWIETSVCSIGSNRGAVRRKDFSATGKEESKPISRKEFLSLINEGKSEMPEQSDVSEKTTPDVSTKAGAALSGANKTKIQKAYDTLNAHHKAHNSAYKAASKELADLLGGNEPPDEDEPDSDKPELEKKPEKEFTPEAKELIDVIRKEFNAKYDLLLTSIEELKSEKGGCDCDHVTKEIDEPKTLKSKDLKQILEETKNAR